MSDELLHHGYEQSRLLSDDEKLLLTALLSNRADFRHLNQQIVSGKVIDMLDGGMGSVKFLTAEERSLGATLVEAEYLDTDGVPVSIVINADNRGDLYELDFWKVDFSSLKQFPRPEQVKMRAG